MKAGIKKHIRQLLWDYQHIEKKLQEYEDVMLMNRNPFLEYPVEQPTKKITISQIAFHKLFLQTVEDILADSTRDVQDIFLVKYKNGYPYKKNEFVACETFLSESTIARRDTEFIHEIAYRLGWYEI
ncbi:transcriptional regulator [Enterococcus faecalis]|uniref:transcriptional regulator n=1 Tax=Enterococcus faecalis TaxID=1351 RepID=UPI00200EBB2F|nr:transcriptional regulator [Enterococcus faecalis]UQF48201.1 transcriptional regulator [Enterococcus faecalis]